MNLWQKFTAWLAGTVLPDAEKMLSDGERIVLDLLKPLLSAAEAQTLANSAVFVKGVLATLSSPQNMSMSDLETAVVNSAGAFGQAEAQTLKNLGSAALQSLVGAVLAQIVAASEAQAKAATTNG